MTAQSKPAGYHHGDLRTALVGAATELIESGESFSLRAVARKVGVSAAAPYRHFKDREQLESAIAASGFEVLLSQLKLHGSTGDSSPDIPGLAVVYVRYALDHPAVFRLMFGQGCADANDDRVIAAKNLQAFLETAVGQAFPNAKDEALPTALWSLAHGLAFLHLDGKLPSLTSSEVDRRVRQAFGAVLTGGQSEYAAKQARRLD
ncbi:TetR/AcrR family transcriptional regulator [Glutamicibacter sp.]|uniref:TetR/AcrR family transcriptional regulator n=1 Tax=Glutamicibacter sp. TaxID=1931995 RepID=UPI0028BDE5DF|nr:TetR/AcrR family transcriptional regulator [Glutamicibacter sp.]